MLPMKFLVSTFILPNASRVESVIEELVESICRGRGFWSSQFNNWLVFDQFKAIVLSELEQIARQV